MSAPTEMVPTPGVPKRTNLGTTGRRACFCGVATADYCYVVGAMALYQTAGVVGEVQAVSDS